MIRFGTLEDYLGALSQGHRKKLANPPEPASGCTLYVWVHPDEER